MTEAEAEVHGLALLAWVWEDGDLWKLERNWFFPDACTGTGLGLQHSDPDFGLLASSPEQLAWVLNWHAGGDLL